MPASTSLTPWRTLSGVSRLMRPSSSSSPQSPHVEPSGRCFHRFATALSLRRERRTLLPVPTGWSSFRNSWRSGEPRDLLPMDFSLTEPEQDLVRLCRDFAQKEIAPRAPIAWEEARCPTDLLREMGELGLLGMLVPQEWGGIGMSTVGFVAAMEQIGLADQSVAAAWQAHVTIGSLPLYLFGTDEQRERWLR